MLLRPGAEEVADPGPDGGVLPQAYNEYSRNSDKKEDDIHVAGRDAAGPLYP